MTSHLHPESDIRKTPFYGGLFNLSILATQLLVMAAVVNLFAATVLITVGAIDTHLVGADTAIVRTGVEYEKINDKLRQGFEHLSNDTDHDKKLLVARLVSIAYRQQTMSSYLIPLWCFVLLAFSTIRYLLIDKNKKLKPNKDKQQKAVALLENIKHSLEIQSPIAIGQRTAFYRSTLMLSMQDYLSVRSGNSDKVAEVKYIVQHEMCHKICRDNYLMYTVKIVTAFSCALLACFYGLMSNALPFFLIGLQSYGIIMSLTACIISYGWYRLFFVGFYYFSRLKEHWADEYALAITQNFAAAKSAIIRLNDSDLHPAPKLRIDYLQQRQTTLPLQLFLMLNFIWMMALGIPHHFYKSLFIIQDTWFSLAFMLVNTPLIILIALKNNAEATRRLSAVAICLMLSLILILTCAYYFLYASYVPSLNESFTSHLWNSLQPYHLWFVMVLILAQWPQKSVNKTQKPECQKERYR